MSTKTLLLSGAAFMNRLISQKSPNLNLQLVSPAIDTTPKLFPSQFISELGTSSVQFPQNDVGTRLSSGGFLYPCGLPSLEFFLPDAKLQRAVTESLFGGLLRAGQESQLST